MWTLIFLALNSVIVGISTACSEQSLLKECHTNGEPQTFPASAQELQTFCQYMLTFHDCAEKYVETSCDDVHDPLANYIRKINPSMKHICNNESVLYRELENILPCLKSESTYILRCTSEFNYEDTAALTNFATILDQNNIAKLDVGDEEEASCLKHLLMNCCWASNVGQRCGEPAKVTVVQLMQELSSDFDTCLAQLVDKLPYIGSIMESRKSKNNF